RQYPLEPFLRTRFPLWHEAIGSEYHPRQYDSANRDQQCGADERILDSGWCLRRRPMRYAERRLADHWIQPPIETFDRANRDRSRQIQPSAEYAQNAQDDQRPSHDPRRLCQILALAVGRTARAEE